MRKVRILLAGASLAASVVGVAWGAGFLTNGLPPAGGTQYPFTVPLTGNETIPADTNLPQGQNPASEAVSLSQLAGFMATQASKGNALIGGDPTTNLWQRSTAGTATTSTTPAYDGPDRFAQWSVSAGPGVQVSRDSTSSDLFPGYEYSMKVAHTNTTGGQICIGQEIESVNSYQFDGATAELDFHAYLGAGYSGGSTLTAYVIYGTGTDEGLGKMAYTVNAAGTSPGWTGGTLASSAVIPLSTVSTGGRFGAVAAIPATATEVGIAVCYTAGTTDTNDYVTLAGLQLVRNANLTSYAPAPLVYASTSIPLTAFERRTQQVETAMQQRYYWQWAETVSAQTASPFLCSAQSATVAVCKADLPVQLRAAPVVACTFGTLKRMVAGTETALSGCAAAATTNGVSDQNSISITATVASGDTAGLSGTLISGNSTGGGLITATSEL